MSNNNLKECPFCGGEAKLHKKRSSLYTEEYYYFIQCDKCLLTTQSVRSMENLIEYWNNRIQPIKCVECSLLDTSKCPVATGYSLSGNNIYVSNSTVKYCSHGKQK